MAPGVDRARNHCEQRTVLGIVNKHGTYAEYLTLPPRNLHAVPDSVSTENAAFAEPLAAACRVEEQGLVSSGQRVAVVGDGKLGILIAEVLGRRNDTTLFGRHPEKMALVTADVTVASSDEPLPARSFDVVVDATGTPTGLDAARHCAGPWALLC